MQVTLARDRIRCALEAQCVFAHDRKIKIVKKVSYEPQFFFAHSESIFIEVFSTAHQFS